MARPRGQQPAFIACRSFVSYRSSVHKMNYPASVPPSWEYRENALARQRRPAIGSRFFLRSFSSSSTGAIAPVLHRELSRRPSDDLRIARNWSPPKAPTSGSGAAYRATREGLPFADGHVAAFSGVQHDLATRRFLSGQSTLVHPDEWRFNTHDPDARSTASGYRRDAGSVRTARFAYVPAARKRLRSSYGR